MCGFTGNDKNKQTGIAMIVVIGVVFSVFLFFAYVCLIIMFNLSLLYHHVLTKIYGARHLQVIMSSIFCDFTYVCTYYILKTSSYHGYHYRG